MTEEKHEDVTEDAVPVSDPENETDLIPDVPALDLDDIETFDQEVEKHDEVGEEKGSDGDAEAAEEGSAAEEASDGSEPGAPEAEG